MFDIGHINESVLAQVARQSDDARRGRLWFARGANARHLTVREARRAVTEGVDELFEFDASLVPSYVLACPDVFAQVVEGGSLADCFGSALRASITDGLLPLAIDIVLGPDGPGSAGELFADVDATRSEAIKFVPQYRFHDFSLKAHVNEAKADPTESNFDYLRDELEAQAKQMRDLVINLDIADPPTAVVCARIGRRFEEAASVIEAVLATDGIDVFAEDWRARRRTA